MFSGTTGKRIFNTLCFFIILMSGICIAQDKELEFKGIYAEIDMSKDLEVIEALSSQDPETVEEAITKVLENPSLYTPLILYAVSNLLFLAEMKDYASMWFYLGQLRARYDANRCADPTASMAVHILNQQYGPMINQYTFQDLDKLERIVDQVMEIDRIVPYNYDHRWINLHGMEAVNMLLNDDSETAEEPVLSLPQEQWEEIWEKTRDEYLSDFREGIKQLRESE
ncbi:hypothetical protein CHISP_0550 [Chitinispirillum alkaliphilum]|nr:hypothetical protein CHISP_0550 [Chitinispirillum alkaliphilum]